MEGIGVLNHAHCRMTSTVKVSKGAKIRNRYNQVHVLHLTKDTNGKVTNSELDTTNESQVVSPFPAGDHNMGKRELIALLSLSSW